VALSYLMGRLTADPDQRLGAIDLVADLGYEPLALAQASAVIASSVLSCRDYRGYFARRREHMAQAAGSGLAAATVTWTFSAEQADRLSPRSAQALLALASLLDGNGIPAEVFTTSAACGYLAGEGAGRAADRELAEGALLVLERVGLLATGSATTPTVRVNPVIQAAVRAAAPALRDSFGSHKDIRDKSPRQSAGCRANKSRAAPLDALKSSASASKWPGTIMSSFDPCALPEAQAAAPAAP
jgi:hypothetical protein